MFGKSHSTPHTPDKFNRPGKHKVPHTPNIRQSLLLAIGVFGLVTLAALTVGAALFGASAQAGSAPAQGYLGIAPPAQPASIAAPSVACSTFSFGAATNFTVGASPYSVAVGDFNRDG